MSKKANTSTEVHEIIANRWSPRAFDAVRTVAPQDILSLLEAARWAPSCFNDQPWRFIVFNKAENSQAWEVALSCLAGKNQMWAMNAPLLLAVIANESFVHNNKPNRWAQYDTGAASLSICFQAQALGLYVHQMGGFDADKVKAKFNVPENCTVMAMMAIGYLGKIESLAEDFVAGEKAERQRAALNERFYQNIWGGVIETDE